MTECSHRVRRSLEDIDARKIVGRDFEHGSLFLFRAAEGHSLAGSLAKEECQLVASWPLCVSRFSPQHLTLKSLLVNNGIEI